MSGSTAMEVTFGFKYRVDNGEVELLSASLFGLNVPLSQLPSIELEELQDAAQDDYQSRLQMQVENQTDEYRHEHCTER
jgi:hypothetical protein